MKDDIDTVVARIEQLHAADLVQDGIVGVVRHIVGHDGGEGNCVFEGEDATKDEVLSLATRWAVAGSEADIRIRGRLTGDEGRNGLQTRVYTELQFRLLAIVG